MTDFFFRDGRPLDAQENARVIVGKRETGGTVKVRVNCHRCGGAGGSEHWRATGWTCFRCGGAGTEIMTRRVFTAEWLATLNERAARKQDKRAAEADARRQDQRQKFIAWAKPRGKLIGGILRSKGNTFLEDLAHKLRNYWILTDNQMDAAKRVIDARDARALQDVRSTHVGDIGQRMEFEGVIEGVYGSEGYYGHTDIVKLRDTHDNVFTWFASGYTDLERGDRVKIRGTIKKHDEYRGVNQTVITRCKVLEKFTVMTADEAANAEAIA